MKSIRLFALSLSLIFAGVLFAANSAEASSLVQNGSTGCAAPLGGKAVGTCSNSKIDTTPNTHTHWHWHHHFSWRSRFHHHVHFVSYHHHHHHHH